VNAAAGTLVMQAPVRLQAHSNCSRLQPAHLGEGILDALPRVLILLLRKARGAVGGHEKEGRLLSATPQCPCYSLHPSAPLAATTLASPKPTAATHLQLVVLLVLQAHHEVGVALPRRPHRLGNGHRPLPRPVAHLVQLRLHLVHAAAMGGGVECNGKERGLE